MFWTEIGTVVKIERAGMDGSERVAVVNTSLGWPGGVAVDTSSDRVYWTDERLGAIGSATFDGDDIRVNQYERDLMLSVVCFNRGFFFALFCMHPINLAAELSSLKLCNKLQNNSKINIPFRSCR